MHYIHTYHMYTMYIKDLQRMYLHYQFIYRWYSISFKDAFPILSRLLLLMMKKKMTHNGLITLIIILHTLNLIYICNRFPYLQNIIINITITITITTIHDNKNSFWAESMTIIVARDRPSSIIIIIIIIIKIIIAIVIFEVTTYHRQ